jgi:hypothetical protein
MPDWGLRLAGMIGIAAATLFFYIAISLYITSLDRIAGQFIRQARRRNPDRRDADPFRFVHPLTTRRDQNHSHVSSSV